MPTLTIRAARHGPLLHQENWGTRVSLGWRRFCLMRARHRQRKALRDLADDPHLLSDIGVTREQALQEADKPFWR
ncbi:DUF1127 domain-containing protein [Bradyrhizobium sp. CCGUVB1N3]|uniref:DUF1127 domain-containing protein n=1 Tax=Bradyrhizobium sp. CCGUVB1N3 TaxID=2949629 RepID=UPI0020B25CE9|nr:DUF1127 domain-containing protein [Bradyrhizobium sp. CCGUVB1N3]MCP3470999.1 DUF1127 domain-containing protein [Bradyrhizobium sp. CCGUVB1N3]